MIALILIPILQFTLNVYTDYKTTKDFLIKQRKDILFKKNTENIERKIINLIYK